LRLPLPEPTIRPRDRFRPKGIFELVGTSHFQRQQLYPQSTSSLFGLLDVSDGGRTAGVPDCGYSSSLRNSLLEEFQLFAAQVFGDVSEAGYIPSWRRKTSNRSLANRIITGVLRQLQHDGES